MIAETDHKETTQATMQEIFKLLHVTFDKSSKSEDIIMAQNQLIKLNINNLNQIKLILSGVAAPDLYTENLKLSAMIYLKNLILGNIKNEKIAEEEVWELLKYFIEFLLASELNEKIMANTISLIQSLFNLKAAIKSPHLTCDLLKTIEAFLKVEFEKTSDNEANFKVDIFKKLISLLQTLIATKSVNVSNLKQIFDLNLSIIDLIMFKNEKIIHLLIPQISDPNTILPYFEITRQIFDLLFLITVKIKDFEKSEEKLEIIINKYAVACYNFIIDLKIPNEYVIVYITANEELDKVLNSVKAKSFQLLSALIQYGSIDIKNSIIQEICVNLIDVIIKNLNMLVTKDLYLIEKYEGSLDLLFYHIFLFLSRCLNREPILTNFFPFVKKFIVCTLFPFLIASNKEKILMKSDGEEYQGFIHDIISDHKSRTSRTSIDFLIVRMSEKYDGLANFLINFCLQVLDFAFNSNESIFTNATVISPNYTLLTDSSLNFNEILHVFNQESLIDISLILLCSMYNSIEKSPQNIGKLKLIFDNYINQLHLVGSDLIKFDICLIYGVFLQGFMAFSESSNEELENQQNAPMENQNFQKRLDFLFACLMDYEKNPGTSVQAAKAITTAFSKLRTDSIDSDYISGVFRKLINHMESIDLSLYFDVLIDILCSCRIEHNLIFAINNATKRILKEIKSQKYSTSKIAGNIVSKCMNIIKTIIEENELFNDTLVDSISDDEDTIIINKCEDQLKISCVEKSLRPLMRYLKNPLKIDFDEDLLEILHLILQNSQTLTRLTKEIFPSISEVVKKNCGLDMSTFQILNLYIQKDDGFIFNSTDNLSFFVELFIQTLKFEEQSDYSTICAAVLLQILPHNKFNATIPENLIIKIIEEMINQINELNQIYVNQYNCMNNTLDMHIFSCYLTTVYSYLIKYPEITFSSIVKKGFVEIFIQLTDLINYFTYYSTQQSKIIILGICSIISNETLLLQIIPFLNKILAQLFTLLFRQKNEESKKIKQLLNDEFDCNFIDSDIEDTVEQESDDDYNLSEEKNHNKEIKSIKKSIHNFYNPLGFFDISKKFSSFISLINNPVGDFDEYDIFSKVICKLRSEHQINFLDWEKSLDQNQKNFWNELIHTRRINLNIKDKTTLNVPRRIVKIKRTFNENEETLLTN